MATGYVYVLMNPSMPGLLKIGRTERDPEVRLSELSGATGVATPFMLLFKKQFGNCIAAEAYIHAEFEKKRVANNREFFRMEPSDAISMIAALPPSMFSLGTSAESESDACEEDDEDDENIVYLDEDEEEEEFDVDYRLDELMDEAEDAVGKDKAMRLYEQAAAIGGGKVWLRASFRFRLEGKDRLSEELLIRAADDGQYRAFIEMAKDHALNLDGAGELRCWHRFFTHFDDDPSPDKFALVSPGRGWGNPLIEDLIQGQFFWRFIDGGKLMRDYAKSRLASSEFLGSDSRKGLEYAIRRPHINDAFFREHKGKILSVLDEIGARPYEFEDFKEIRAYIQRL